jgi:DNA-binding LytR/AlgR family response regulator
MVNPFKQPYKEVEPTRDKIVSILVFGLFIFLFLFLFKPFGLYQLKQIEQLLITFGFGLVTTFMLFIFKYLLEPVVTKNNWTFGKSLIWDLVIASSIGVANYFYITIIFNQILAFRYLMFSVWTAILVGSIPVTISYIIAFNKRYKNALKEASIPAEDILWEGEVRISAGNPKNEFCCNPGNIVYFTSNDNYVTIVTIKGGTLTKTHLRGTLKAVEKELSKNNRFLRCHKCFIVNTEYVDHLIGNSQNMKIRLNLFGLDIPVSRSKASSVSKRLKIT